MGLQLNEIDRFNLLKQLVKKPDIFQSYDPTVKIPREEVEDLIDVAIQAPSSWEQQHWKFLIFDDQHIKEDYLYPLTGYQTFVRDASAIVVLLGDHKVYDPNTYLEQGMKTYNTKEEQPEMVAINKLNQERDSVANLAFQSLTAIQFMLSATAKGYDTYPTLHFDGKQLAETFNIPEQFIPVLVIAIGKRKESNEKRSQGFKKV